MWENGTAGTVASLEAFSVLRKGAVGPPPAAGTKDLFNISSTRRPLQQQNTSCTLRLWYPSLTRTTRTLFRNKSCSNSPLFEYSGLPGTSKRGHGATTSCRNKRPFHCFEDTAASQASKS
ncbi:uncharacterized protein HMPREF1120_04579 [Exophiala dermatitidis NIH/UT8656]|uniref:Uncharacterized protein n=1 Tax=Exophiala dermatitidis (strain ATCC 34100 / CBS 525.76 / NIH/UT8656) TaxID=858893 RepID=H6C127_EXODN|nr:uncharacterized protein HMPREF1120_04579 [Exophiala dermatitidis NIH/UT8656]EHY56498.1 hypothetical protein HMPREF1120_04579 [Exophiala dermatitidis NIH/UT8656]